MTLKTSTAPMISTRTSSITPPSFLISIFTLVLHSSPVFSISPLCALYLTYLLYLWGHALGPHFPADLTSYLRSLVPALDTHSLSVRSHLCPLSYFAFMNRISLDSTLARVVVQRVRAVGPVSCDCQQPQSSKLLAEVLLMRPPEVI